MPANTERTRRIADLLVRRGMTYRQLATAADISSLSTLSDLMCDDDELEIGFDIPDILAIGEVLGEEFWKIADLTCPACGSVDLGGPRSAGDHARAGARAAAARTEAGIALSELSDRVGYRESFLVGLESGAPIKGARLGDMRLLADTLHLSLAALLGLECRTCGWK